VDTVGSERSRAVRGAGAGETLELGGLHFTTSFREVGATLRVEGPVDGSWTELLRFDDFVDGPHYHAPASGDPIAFDRRAYGEPLAWFVAQIRDHLGEWLERSGFGDLLPLIDLDAVRANADRITEAMTTCLPDGFVRVPGVGLQRTDAPS
jgi:hypothetical protein